MDAKSWFKHDQLLYDSAMNNATVFVYVVNCHPKSARSEGYICLYATLRELYLPPIVTTDLHDE